jgi:hypothetical protein
MTRTRNVVRHRKPKSEFTDLWAALIEQHKQELNNVAKAIDALAARFEEIDRKYEQRLLAFAQPLFFDNRDDMERRMDELTPLYSETHDPKVKTELEELSWKLTDMLKRHRRRV